MARIHRRAIKKGLNDLDNHNGVVTDLEPYIQEYEVKWTLGSITTNKATGGGRIPAELFQSLKYDAFSMIQLKCCIQYASKLGKLNTGYKTGKDQFSFQSQRRTMPKNVQTTVQLCSFCMLVWLCSKSFKIGFSNILTMNFQMYKMDLGKAEQSKIKLTTIDGL